MKNAATTVILFMGSGVILAVLGMALKAWIAIEISGQLAAAGVVPRSEIAQMQEDIEDNEMSISTLTERWNRLVDAIAAK